MANARNIEQNIEVLKSSIDSLKDSITSFGSKFGAIVEQFNDLNKKSLSISKVYTDVATRGATVTEGLNLSLNSKFSIGLELNRQAISGNNRELIKLASTQEALGKSSAPTIAAFRELQVALRLSENQTNSLARVTLESALKYGVSTEVLVNQLQKLQPVMETLSLAGGDTSQFAAFVSELTSKLGGERNAENVAKALTVLTDVSSKNQNILARFGVQDLSRRLISGKGSSEEQANLAIEAIRRFSAGVQSMQGSQIENIRLLQEMTGGTASLFLSLNNELENTANNLKENNPGKMFGEIMNNLDNLLKSAFAPIEAEVVKAFKVLVDAATPVILFFTDLIKSISEMDHFTDLLIIGFTTVVTLFGVALIPILLALVSSFTAILVPLFPLIAAIVALGLAVYAVMRIFDFGFKDIFAKIAEYSDVILGVIKFIALTLLGPFVVILMATWNLISKAFKIAYSTIESYFIKPVMEFYGRILGVSISFKQVFSNLGDYLMLVVYRLAQGFNKVLSLITFGDTSQKFKNNSIEYQIKADNLAKDLQERSLRAEEESADNLMKIEDNTRKEIKIPDFIKTSNKELEDAFRVMLGLQTTNPVVTQMVALNENVAELVSNSSVQTENSTQAVQAQNKAIQGLKSVDTSVKNSTARQLSRYPNASRTY